MASTPIAELIVQIRANLKEPIPNYWSDEDLLAYLRNGARDLWRKLLNLYEEHFTAVNSTDCWLDANTAVLYGVPEDCFRVLSLEPRVLGSASPNQGLIFKPRRWTTPEFVRARAADPVDPQANILYWTQFKPGAPVDAPEIRVAPMVSAAVNLTITYNPTLAAFDETDRNPIPGESDQALIAWATAYALGRQLGVVDPGWLSVYATEKLNLASEIPPRQIQEPELVEGMFDGYEF